MPLQRRQSLATLHLARELVDSGDLSAAQELLSDWLTTLPSDPRKARPAEAEAVALQTGVLLSLGDANAARGWAAYGHACFRRLYGEHDRRTLHALGLLAAVLTRVAAHGRAAQRYQRLIEIFTELDGPRSERALAARADLATVEHARGQCVTARQRLAEVIGEHQAGFGAAHPVGVRMLARLAAMWRDCANPHQSQALLAQARTNAVALDDQIQELLESVAHTPPNPQHECGAVLPVVEGVEDEQALAPVARAEVAILENPLEPPFSTVSYLPAHPLLLTWEPLPPVASSANRAKRPIQLPAGTVALVAAIIGIVAVTVLFSLLVATVRGG